jgi:hypothetical protein
MRTVAAEVRVERFDAARLCPDCGGRAASYKLHTHPCAGVGAAGDHMHRTCPFCAHEWAESTRSPNDVIDLRLREEHDAETSG